MLKSSINNAARNALGVHLVKTLIDAMATSQNVIFAKTLDAAVIVPAKFDRRAERHREHGSDAG